MTFPRSGHHFLAQCLDQLCGIRQDYCETYACLDCYRAPVCCPGKQLTEPEPVRQAEAQNCQLDKRFVKHHDLYRAFNWQAQHLYIIQYRHPLESITSWFDFELDTGAIETDSHAYFQNFLEEKLDQWRYFADKWIIAVGQEKQNAIAIEYGALTATTSNYLRYLQRCMDFATLPVPEADVLQQVAHRLRPRRALDHYRYFDHARFQEIEQDLKPVLDKTEITLLFA